jgi:acetoacetyl-CoA reductase/3-oxoacyl-[acyl-carrier protein] reductase
MILITGASKGIGKFLFHKFSEKGFPIFGTFYSTKPQDFDSGRYSQVQVENFSSVKKWIDSIPNKENIVLINCAGINYNCFAHKCDVDRWREVIDVNLIGTFNAIRAVLPTMRNDNYGRIINFSSIVAQSGVLGASAYAASKSGLWGMAKSIAKENGSKNITINNLNLGYFDIGIISEVPKDYQNKIKSQIPSGEFGNPEEIYKAVNFLINSDYVNGTSIDINGGLY